MKVKNDKKCRLVATNSVSCSYLFSFFIFFYFFSYCCRAGQPFFSPAGHVELYDRLAALTANEKAKHKQTLYRRMYTSIYVCRFVHVQICIPYTQSRHLAGGGSGGGSAMAQRLSICTNKQFFSIYQQLFAFFFMSAAFFIVVFFVLLICGVLFCALSVASQSLCVIRNNNNNNNNNNM
ncbi:unnamed protein product [Ceratitis capitata]|uniref:(Mediterranean fruit fly) hypothetical protein n=1 Tax=Ceratitis capitata TaxID=7213 RepID=A0A811UAJ0_CERCA|nr:unnamed protein product [Ceratitis capitata]